ncbi:MAG: type II toxin-antitoxin system VapC family toxin [Rhizobacter sp.]|nr:type II toxin-antitoxin system VapC family toxin [Chlorobiales bacterium]
MRLVDSNVWLEILLEQQRQPQAEIYLNVHRAGGLCISLFSLDSIGVVLYRSKQWHKFELFLSDLLRNKVRLYALSLNDLVDLDRHLQQWKLDYDDAYQYTLAKKLNLELVSFDKDFDKTDLTRLEP